LETEKFDTYVDHFEIYATCYEVDDARKLSFFLAIVGPKIYLLLVSLCALQKPTKLEYADAVQLLKSHLCLELLTYTERHRFRNRRQNTDETIAAYVVELRKLAATCKFEGKERLEENFVPK